MKKIAALCLLFGFAAAAGADDWRAAVAGFLDGKGPDGVREARIYLARVFDSLGDEDKPAACGLLAFLAHRQSDRKDEYARLGDYFEKYGSLDAGYYFLSPGVRAEVSRYLRDWQLRYPWVLKIGLVTSRASLLTTSLSPPEKLLLGVEMANPVLYKFSSGNSVIKGGEFRRGFNALAIEARDLLDRPGAHTYVLEFKAEDMIVRREIVFGVEMSASGVTRTPAVSGPPADYLVKLYLGETLLASSRKSQPVSLNAEVEAPPPTGEYDPFGPGYQNEPKFPSSISIMAIPAVIKELIDQLKKKNEVEPVPEVELKNETTFIFSRTSAAGREIEIRARLTLGLRAIAFLPYDAPKSPAGPPAAFPPENQR